MVLSKRRDGGNGRFVDDSCRIILTLMVNLEYGGINTFTYEGVEGEECEELKMTRSGGDTKRAASSQNFVNRALGSGSKLILSSPLLWVNEMQ